MARFLAIDWDQGQLHVVAATTGRGGTVTVQKAAVWHENRSPNPAEAEELGKLLRDRLKEAGIAAAPVTFCIGRDRVILKDLKYPLVQPHEEPQMVRHQVLKELTDAPSDVIIDFVSSQTGPKEIRAQVVILRKELLTTFQGIAKAAGLKLAGLTPRPFGSAVCVDKLVGASPAMPHPEPAHAPIALVTVADKWAEFSVMRKGQLLLTRALNVGPNLAGEIRRNLAVYSGQTPQQPIGAVYLALSEVHENGAPTFDPMLLKQRLTEMVEIPVHLFDPFPGVEGPEVPAGLRGSFVGAVGVLHSVASTERMPINFVAPRNPAPPSDPRNRSYMLVACLLFAVVVALGSLAWFHLNRVTQKAILLEAEEKKKGDELAKLQTEAKIEKALENWETVVWLDELYDLTAMAPKIDQDFQLSSMEGAYVKPSKGAPHVGRLTVKGTTSNPDRLKQLAEELHKDQGPAVGAYYRPKAPDVKKNEFSAEILIKKRPPSEYQRALPTKKEGDKKPEKPVVLEPQPRVEP